MIGAHNMAIAAELLAANRIELKDGFAPGRHYAVCPQCSPSRSSRAHQQQKCLGVTIEADGAVRWGCNHCGWQGPEKGAKRGNGADRADRTTYDYCDAGGALLFRKVRTRQKKFWMERPDGKGGWIKNAEGVGTSVLYHADEVGRAIAAGRIVCVAEGERDADTLRGLGFVATCNAHGASDPTKRQKPKWDARHSAQLASAEIIVLNDNDMAGYAHADAVCKLSLGVAKRVRRLDLEPHWSGMPKGADVSDWIAQGKGVEALKTLIEGAPDYSPGEAKVPSQPTPEAEVNEDAELARLARLPLFEYERGRKAAADALGLRASILDKLVAGKRTELGLNGGDGKQGRPIEFADIAPCTTPVAGPALLDEIAAAFGRHVVMGDHQRVAIALWVVHAHLIDRAMISPRLAIRSAIKGSGKTTLVDIVARLVPRPLSAASVTPSAIFRVIAAHRPTVLVDEADTIFHEGDEALRGILNAGHRQGGAVLRSVGDDFEPRAFPCYAATVIALIGQLPATLADRSIDVVLARRRPSEEISPFRLDQTERLDELTRRIARWAKDNGERLSRDPDMPASLYNRAADNWRPLLAIADAAGGKWSQAARQAAVAMAGGDIDEVSRTELLLSDIRDIFAASGDDEITSATLIERLVEIMPRPWCEYGRSGKPITQNKLARLLNPLGIGPGLIDTDGHNRLSGYRLARFAEAFERYLPPIPPSSNLSTSPNPDKTNTSDDLKPLRAEERERFENRVSPMPASEGEVERSERGGSARSAGTAANPPANASQRPTNSGSPVYEVLGPVRPGQRCSICDGSIGVKRIKYAGAEQIWHEACAKRRLSAGAGMQPPEVIVAAARGAGVVFQLAPDGDLFTLEWRGPVDPLINDAIRDAYEPILDLLRREAVRQ